MNVSETLRGLWRRWYIVVPGLVLTVALAVGSFVVVKPGYERTATQLLLPGKGLVPEGTSNPYLFLGGLTQAADILVRAVGAEETLAPIVESHPGTQIEVVRDPRSSGPVILFTVTAPSDADAAAALDEVLAVSVATLDRLQNEQHVSPDDRVSISGLTTDIVSTPQQRTRLIVAVGAGIGGFVLTLILASLVDGLIRRGRRTARRHDDSDSAVASTDVIEPDVDDESSAADPSVEPRTEAPDAPDSPGRAKAAPVTASRVDATPGRANRRGTRRAEDRDED